MLLISPAITVMCNSLVNDIHLKKTLSTLLNPPYNFGTLKLLLTIAQPHNKNTSEATWTPHTLPSAITPNGSPFLPSYQPFHTQTAIIVSRARVVGMGKPSKYLAFPLASLGRDAAVTLKRARRDNPESRKKERIRVSIGVRKPNVYAIAEGATPNDTYPTVLALHIIIIRNIVGRVSTRSARESNS
jgi:hypothetical protein